MRALDGKLPRDLRRLRSQALAIAPVLGCGVAVFLTSFGMSAALEETRAACHERSRLADIFAGSARAPPALLPEFAAIPGVAAVRRGWSPTRCSTSPVGSRPPSAGSSSCPRQGRHG